MTEADEMLTGVGELLFSLLIGYLGALEFAFVARHLYHWTCRHPVSDADLDAAADAQELPRMRERLDREYEEAAAKEAAAGSNMMQDGVLYSNGFRVESPEEKHRQLEEELARQRRIEEETRKQLAQAEQRLEEERRKAEQEAKAAAEAAVAEAAESARKLIEAEKQREAEQRRREEEEEKEKERQLREEAEQREREENERKLLEAENERQRQQQEEEEKQEEEKRKQREQQEKERQQREEAEREENERKLREAERQRELAQAEVERQLLQPDADEEEVQAKRDAEIVERLLAAERERERNLSATESELEEEALALEQSRRLAASKVNLERKQRSIEENARIFMEAEEEMVALQQRMLEQAREEEATIYAGCVPVVEEPCIKKICPPRFEEPQTEEPCEEPLVVQRVKTQFGQASGGAEVKSKTLMFPGVSDEGSSVEPQSSFSTQPSDEQRQEPEGEDNVPDVQYTEDYLRSLDGIKSRPLVREDGSGRRRAFKKRRSSGSSNSSRDSRASRDEEVKMFTSLEEEELRHGEKADYNPIKYSTEPTTLRVKSHHRRHKRSPAKDVKHTDSSGSLEMLGEESTNPWGEVVPEHYKDTEFWKREKALSIDEEVLDLGKLAAGEDVQQEEHEEEEEVINNKPKASSFEEATEAQNAQAASALQQQRSKEQLVSGLA